jgi:hypothetical protein
MMFLGGGRAGQCGYDCEQRLITAPIMQPDLDNHAAWIQVEDKFLGRTRVGKVITAGFDREGVLEKWVFVFQRAFSAKNLPGPRVWKKVPTGPILGGEKAPKNTTQV